MEDLQLVNADKILQSHDIKLKAESFTPSINNTQTHIFNEDEMNPKDKQSEAYIMKSNNITQSRLQVTMVQNNQFSSIRQDSDLHKEPESESNDKIMMNNSDSLKTSTSIDNEQTSSVGIQSKPEQKDLEMGKINNYKNWKNLGKIMNFY